ncbi:hypothetical protein [Treponema sp. UBA3813]|uniref:hypothetical protein n=1 Tax=Treponema sp. UBA3813 TaxID=1947715 RepID=UPI0025FE21BE|nr:hypothetical protein [Treponema sp. UBA3813]
MSDSDKTNELDNYGVWVKKPPRTVSSEIEENADALSDSEIDLPDFSSIDVVDEVDNSSFGSGETALSQDELANIAGMGSFEESSPEAAPSGETEEISLDEFIEGGVFDGDDTAAPASSESSGSSEESVSTDEFMDSSDITVSDEAPSVSEAPALSDEGPIDIDLSFDDSESSAGLASGSSAPSAPVAEVPGSEDVDLSDFGVDFDSGDTSSDSPAASTSDDGTESVDLSDFGFDINAPESNGESEPEQESEPAAEEPKINEDGTEEISLDSFGFDINAEESSGESEAAAPAEETASTEDDFSVSLDDESPALTESEPSEMTVSADDDAGDISIESSSEPEQEEAPAQDFAAPDDDDFDLDSIMDSIEDENGNTSSLNDNAGIVSEPAPEANESVSVENTDEISVVDMEEPVFEETAVDLPESNEESGNPFELPPDDAFTASVTEEPTIHEDSSDTVETVTFDTVPLTEEPVSESAVAEEEPVAEETATEEVVSFEENIAEEPSAEEALTEEPVAEEQAATESVKQDEEISSSANSILSQIASELSSLRSEISNLKSEFEELKNKDSIEETTPEEDNFLAQEPTESESSGGFFDEEDGDETIALSLDEMDNILNTVEIVEEKAPEQDNENTESEESSFIESDANSEAFDFSNDNIEEPVLDDIDTNVAEEELPDEILVPKSNDDILVESSDENLIEDAGVESGENEKTILSVGEEQNEASDANDEDFNFEVAENKDSDSLVDEPFVFDESESSQAEEVSEESESNTPSVEDILGDSASSTDEAEESVSITEGELDTLLSSEAAKPVEEEEDDTEVVQSSIPNNLQKEIKSVLSYMDQLLENLPEEKIAEFAQSEQFETYKKLFKELGLN